MTILIEQLLDFLEERFSKGSKAADLAEAVIKIFENKIFPI
eukprot:CAMPEP_0202966330 /NCGR_PEP_ID=MMETSP1396-20130829/10688_1 /ASSEMBLY_ACC=CAM_ASM_000872 /TAXON_ID= /ORGANISM="Pseudokeronopsis sp., Strain Brazil" /LENGTH=40 /DNA_ID= /DNA_START= /DNA_END= /DNA_ORIENTATION=